MFVRASTAVAMRLSFRSTKASQEPSSLPSSTPSASRRAVVGDADDAVLTVFSYGHSATLCGEQASNGLLTFSIVGQDAVPRKNGGRGKCCATSRLSVQCACITPIQQSSTTVPNSWSMKGRFEHNACKRTRNHSSITVAAAFKCTGPRP